MILRSFDDSRTKPGIITWPSSMGNKSSSAAKEPDRHGEETRSITQGCNGRRGDPRLHVSGEFLDLHELET